jgi:hypothetical protein
VFRRRAVPAGWLSGGAGTEEESRPGSGPSAARTAGVVGVPTGLVAGLLGVGGGALAVPFQQVFLRMPLRNAIANSSATIICVSVVGATFKNIRLVQNGMAPTAALTLAVFLIPTAMVGGYFGARLTHRAPLRVLRVMFVLLMVYAGWKLFARSPVPEHAAQPSPAAQELRDAAPTEPTARRQRERSHQVATRIRPITQAALDVRRAAAGAGGPGTKESCDDESKRTTHPASGDAGVAHAGRRDRVRGELCRGVVDGVVTVVDPTDSQSQSGTSSSSSSSSSTTN